MENWTREDERAGAELRPVSVRVGDIDECDGSARWVQGGTTVVAAVYIVTPQALHPQYAAIALESYDQATIVIDVSLPASISSSGSNAQKRKERWSNGVVEQALHAAVDLKTFPNQAIVIKATVVTDAGNTLACLINCSVLALINSGLPMKCTPTASSMSIFGVGRILMDPTAKEEKNSSCNCVFVSGHIVTESTAAAAAEYDPPVLLFHIEGTCDTTVLDEVMALGKAASLAVVQCMRGAVGSAIKQ